jgi:hypothetical protein
MNIIVTLAVLRRIANKELWKVIKRELKKHII